SVTTTAPPTNIARRTLASLIPRQVVGARGFDICTLSLHTSSRWPAASPWPWDYVIDRGARSGERRRCRLRASGFTVRAHCALSLPITASIAVATGTTHQICRSSLGYRRDERRCFIRSRGS